MVGRRDEVNRNIAAFLADASGAAVLLCIAKQEQLLDAPRAG
jgi:hypothetical protein